MLKNFKGFFAGSAVIATIGSSLIASSNVVAKDGPVVCTLPANKVGADEEKVVMYRTVEDVEKFFVEVGGKKDASAIKNLADYNNLVNKWRALPYEKFKEARESLIKKKGPSEAEKSEFKNEVPTTVMDVVGVKPESEDESAVKDGPGFGTEGIAFLFLSLSSAAVMLYSLYRLFLSQKWSVQSCFEELAPAARRIGGYSKKKILKDLPESVSMLAENFSTWVTNLFDNFNNKLCSVQGYECCHKNSKVTNSFVTVK